MRFNWHEPVAAIGDTVLFRDHQNKTREGLVMRVETTYGCPGADGLFQAHHTYGIRIRGHRNKIWVGDEGIRKIVA